MFIAHSITRIKTIATTAALVALLPVGSRRVAYLGYERRLEDEDAFFDGLKVMQLCCAGVVLVLCWCCSGAVLQLC